MIDFSFFWLPFLVIGIANFFLSWLYYSPSMPWFRSWQVGVGMDPNKRQMSEADRKAMPRLMGGALVASSQRPCFVVPRTTDVRANVAATAPSANAVRHSACC